MSPFGLPSAGYPASARWHVFRFLHSIPLARAAALAVALLAAPGLHAANVTWSSAGTSTPGGDGNWTGGSTWWNGSSAVTWTASDNATFSAAGNTTVNSSVTVGSITFTSSTANISILGGAGDITLNSGITATNSANTTALTFTISESVALGANQTWTVNAGGTVGTADLAVSGIISGSNRGITKAGNGTLSLSGVNTYTGNTTISAGTLQITGSGQLGGGSYAGIIAKTGALTINSTADQTLSGIISGAGVFTKAGAGTLTLSGNNTFGSLTIGINTGAIDGGITSLQHNKALGTSTASFNSGGTIQLGTSGLTISNNFDFNNQGSNSARTFTLDLAGSATGTFSGIFQMRHSAANLVFDVGTDDTLTLSGNIYTGATNGMPVVKNGAGTLIFGSNMTYNGTSTTTTINAGTLEIGAAGRLAAGNYTRNITNNGTLIYSGTSAQTLSGIISGTGALTQNGSATLTLTGNNSYTGVTTVNSGSLRLQNAAANSQTIVGNITISGGILGLATSHQIADTSTVTITGGNFELSTFADTISSVNMSGGSLRRSTGALTLNAASSFTGGSLDFAHANGRINTSGTTTLGNVTFDFSVSGNSTTGLYLGGDIAVNASTTANFTNSGGGLGRIDLNAANRTIDVGTGAAMNVGWTIAGTSVGITKNGSGTLALNAANTYNGTTTLNAGSIQIGHSSGLGSGGNITFSGGGLIYGSGITTDLLSRIKNSGSAILVDTNGESVTWGTAIGSTNSGGLTKNGSGTLTLSANNTYSGATTISAGTLQISSTGLLGGGNYSANIVNNGNLVFGSDSNQTLGGVISGTGGMTKNGTGTLTLAGNNNYSGNTTINTGTVVIGHANAAGSGTITQTDATSLLKFDTTGTITNVMSVYNVLATQSATLSGAITVNNATWDIETGDTLTVSGDISGSGGVTKIGNGTLILSGSNSYNGSTVVNTGTLNANNANALGSNNTVEVNGGTLLVSADDAINGKNITLNGNSTTVATLAFSGNYGGAVGNLTLSANSIIDLGAGSTRLSFHDIEMGIYYLKFHNWTGTTLWDGGTGNDTDRVYIISGVTNNELGKMQFYSGTTSDSFLGTGFDLGLKTTSFDPGLSGYQIIPVPEPETWAAGILLVLGSGVWLWRKRKNFTTQSDLEGAAPSAPSEGRASTPSEKMVGLFRRNDPNQRQSRPRALPANSATT